MDQIISNPKCPLCNGRLWLGNFICPLCDGHGTVTTEIAEKYGADSDRQEVHNQVAITVAMLAPVAPAASLPVCTIEQLQQSWLEIERTYTACLRSLLSGAQRRASRDEHARNIEQIIKGCFRAVEKVKEREGLNKVDS
jgi:hypothetical protein